MFFENFFVFLLRVEVDFPSSLDHRAGMLGLLNRKFLIDHLSVDLGGVDQRNYFLKVEDIRVDCDLGADDAVYSLLGVFLPGLDDSEFVNQGAAIEASVSAYFKIIALRRHLHPQKFKRSHQIQVTFHCLLEIQVKKENS